MAGTPATVRYTAYIGVLGGTPFGGAPVLTPQELPQKGSPPGQAQNPYPGAPAASCGCPAVSEASLRAGGPPERLEHHYRAPREQQISKGKTKPNF